MNPKVKLFLNLNGNGSRANTLALKRVICGPVPSRLESRFALYWQGVKGPELIKEYRFDGESTPHPGPLPDRSGEGVGKGKKARNAALCRGAAMKARLWRFDFAHLGSRVGIEIEGGSWTGGAHTRGKGFAEDCEKYNAAVRQGWRIFRLTGEMITVRELELIKDFISREVGEGEKVKKNSLRRSADAPLREKHL